MLGLALGLAYVSEATVEWVILFWVWYVLSYVLALVAACGHLLLETLRAWNWRRLEHQAQGDWKGGTDECLIVGGLLRRGAQPSTQAMGTALRSGAATMRTLGSRLGSSTERPARPKTRRVLHSAMSSPPKKLKSMPN